jgi:hypothetical protein
MSNLDDALEKDTEFDKELQVLLKKYDYSIVGAYVKNPAKEDTPRTLIGTATSTIRLPSRYVPNLLNAAMQAVDKTHDIFLEQNEKAIREFLKSKKQ